ncbi:MAG: sigma-70 family RNA polymerase sigma factor [Sphingobacteriia bacterium]|nr:sigma-70 family RNA polymerase sigma factor [Sphingobacteriia bacterium]
MIPVKHITSPREDIDLLHEFQLSGDQQVLAILYLRYADLVYGVCIKYLKNQDAAKDAVMTIYEELFQKLPMHQVESFKSWLYVFTKNHCLMQLRKEKKAVMVEIKNSDMQSEDFSHLDDVLEKEKELKKLERCIDTLNMDQNKVIRLFYLENKCYNDIAACTGWDWNKVRSTVQNGRRNLKNCMEQK